MVRDADGHWRLQKAERFLEAAERALAAADFETTVSRAYYAAYHSVIALLEAKSDLGNRGRWDHSQVEAQFRAHFTNRGYLFSRRHADDLRDLLDARLVADYENRQPSLGRVEQHLVVARSLYQAVRQVM